MLLNLKTRVMTDNRSITIAIHTYDHAVALRNLLEREGISVSLQNLHLDRPVIASGIRVRINESDLPMALRIIENAMPLADTDTSDSAGDIPTTDIHYLVPVDFSPHSLKACMTAFAMANRHGATIRLINTVINPSINDNSPLSETMDYDVVDPEVRRTILDQAYTRMKNFTDRLRAMIKSGEMPAARMSAQVIEGIPEEIIIQYAREHRPDIIFMGTRARQAKERDLIGSVTAEVLDSCRIPVITLPGNAEPTAVTEISNAVMFCDMTQTDLLAIDFLYRTFPDRAINIEMISLPDRYRPWNKFKRDPAAMILAYCHEHYPRFTFNLSNSTLNTIEDDFHRIESQAPVNMIVVPNHRRSPLSRLFNPSIAHRLLFHADIPMTVIPV